jgi:hypothetical protein
MMKLRKVERLINNEWKTCRMSELHPEDIFRMWEEDKIPVIANGFSMWIALEYPQEKDKVWGVVADPYTKIDCMV